MNLDLDTPGALDERVMSIIAAELGIERSALSPHSTLKEAGISSLEFIEILFALEEQLFVTFETHRQDIPLETLQDLIDEVRRLSEQPADTAPSA